MNKDNNKENIPEESQQAAVAGKKAIDAEKKAAGEDPTDVEVKKKEQKDAERWRNEG